MARGGFVFYFGEPSSTDGPGARLRALAARLRLTYKQQRFAEALCLSLSRNAAKAARAAGCSPKSARNTACRWRQMPKIRAYMRAMTDEAIRSSNERAVRTLAGTPAAKVG